MHVSKKKENLPGTGEIGPVGDYDFGQEHLGPSVVWCKVIGSTYQRHTKHVGQLLAVDASPVLRIVIVVHIQY